MATRKKAVDPAKEMLVTAIKKTVNTNTVLPILESVYFSGDSAIVSDLETNVILPIKTGVQVCIPARLLIKTMDMVDSISIKVDENFGCKFSSGSREIKMMGDDPGNFPKTPMLDKDYPVIGTLSKEDMGLMKTALKFVSNDDLRPAMTGILLGKKIVATDAHRLFWKDLSGKGIKKEFILPAKTAKILLSFDGPWKVTYNMKGHNVCFTNEAGIKVICRVIDARFPDYKVVLPEGDGNVNLIGDKHTLLAEIKNAMTFANVSTKMVTFSINGKVGISSQDVDFSFEYNNVFPDGAIEVCRNNDFLLKDLRIAFNGAFLSEIIDDQPNDQPVEMKMWASTKAVIINNSYLLMPLMLGE